MPQQEEAQQEEFERDEHGALSFEDTMRMLAAKQSEEPEEPAEKPDWDQGEPESQEEVDAKPDGESEPQEQQEVKEETVEDKKAEANEKSLARIMERESQLLEKERAIDEKLDMISDLRQRVEQYEKAMQSDDLVSLIRSIRPDTDLKRLAEDLWYEGQGDKAPQQYLQKKAANQHNKELAERIAKMERAEKERLREQQERQAQEVFARYTGSLEAFAKQADTESFPLLKNIYSKEGGSDTVHNWMLNAARAHAQQTNGQTLTPEQAAQAVEKQLAFFQAQQSQKENEPKAPARTGASLRNSSQQVNPDREPEDELSDEYLRKKAFEAMGRPDLA